MDYQHTFEDFVKRKLAIDEKRPRDTQAAKLRGDFTNYVSQIAEYE